MTSDSWLDALLVLDLDLACTKLTLNTNIIIIITLFSLTMKEHLHQICTISVDRVNVSDVLN